MNGAQGREAGYNRSIQPPVLRYGPVHTLY